MADFDFSDGPKKPVQPGGGDAPNGDSGLVIDSASPFAFLSNIPVTKESDFQGNKNPPLRFPLPAGSNVSEIIQGLQAINPALEAEYFKGDGVLSILLPSSISIGEDPVDLRELAFVLKCQKEIAELNLPGNWEHCCGDHEGCCANKG